MLPTEPITRYAHVRTPVADLVRNDRLALACVVGGFLASRLMLFRLGIRFNMYPLENHWQHVDPTLLRDRLFESLFYLHSQPPLFNLFLGSVLKLFPSHYEIAFAIAYLLTGLLLAVTLYRLMRWLGVRPSLAAALSLVFLGSPACIYYENLLTYTYPITLLLSATALVLHRFGDAGRTRDACIAFALAAAVVLTRSQFQIIWLALALGVVWCCCSAQFRKKALLGAAAPIAIVGALYVKNFVLFGTYTTSSWFGMNLVSVVGFQLPREERAAWIEDGVISSLGAVGAFASVEAVRPHLPALSRTGIPLLDQERTASGGTNYHHLAYVSVGKQFAADAVAMIRARPSLYCKGLLSSAMIFFWPPTDERYGATEALPRRLSALKWVYNRLVYGQLIAHAPDGVAAPERRSLFNLAGHIGWFVLLGFPLLVTYGLARLRAGFRASGRGGESLALVFMLVSIAYLTAVAIAFEVGENNGFRFTVDPFLWTLLAMWVDERCDRRRGV